MKMMDVTEKNETRRQARALARLIVDKETIKLIKDGKIEKGDPVNASKLVGISGVKTIPSLVPFCHPIRVTGARIDIVLFDEGIIEILSEVSCIDRTGAEMEALSACALAALNVYDMLKRSERWARIADLRLLEKEGGNIGPVKPDYEFKGKIIFLGKSATRGMKERVERITLLENFGVEGDVHAGTEKEVSVFPFEALSKVPREKFNFSIDEITENITIVGIPEYVLLPGKILEVGNVAIEILEIGKEKFVNEGRPYAVSRWGRFCRVIKGGEIRLYDEITVKI